MVFDSKLLIGMPQTKKPHFRKMLATMTFEPMTLKISPVSHAPGNE